MVVFSFPAVIAAMGLVYADRHFGTHVDPIWYLPALFWYYGHPAVYVMFFPFVGCVAEVIPALSRKRFFGYRPFVLSLMVFTALSMSVWGHHLVHDGPARQRVLRGHVDRARRRRRRRVLRPHRDDVGGSLLLRTPLLFAVAFLLQFLIGGLTGVIVASPPLDYSLNDTYFVVAHFHYTLFAGSMFGLFAGVYFWFPKVTGAQLREGLGQIHFWLLVAGTNLTFMPMFVLGYDGMVRRVADYPSDAGFTGMNELATAGSGVIAASMLVFLANVAVSLRWRRAAGDDPWEGHSLEWATTSPPPPGNFDRLPPIRRLRRPSTCEGRARHEAELDLAGRLGGAPGAHVGGPLGLHRALVVGRRVVPRVGVHRKAVAGTGAPDRIGGRRRPLRRRRPILRERRATGAAARSPAGPAVALTAVGAVVAAAGGAVGIWMTRVGIRVAAVGAAGVLAARRRPQ